MGDTGGHTSETGGAGQSGTGGQGGQGGIPDEIQTIMGTYQSWQPLSAQPVDISARIFTLCRGPSPAESAFAASVHGRHALRDWANPAAVTGIIAQGTAGFGVGAAIVKEKFIVRTSDATFVLAALGMMIKRGAGFDSASGDWEFVYWDQANGVLRGATQLASCGSCHAGAGATDFVFPDANWQVPAGP